MKKYELTNETKQVGTHTLHRIKALKYFDNVYAGELGGWIEKEENLSQEGGCWVSDDAMVYGYAQVYDNARVFGNAQVYGYARVSDDAEVSGNARVSGNAQVSVDAMVYGYTQVYGNVRVSGVAMVYGYAQVYDYAMVYGYARVFGNAQVYGDVRVYGDAQVYGDVRVYGNAQVQNDADFIVFKNWWSSGRYFTWTRSNNMWSVGCFYGTGQELVDKAYKDSEESGREYQRIVNYVQDILRLPHIKKTI